MQRMVYKNLIHSVNSQYLREREREKTADTNFQYALF